MVFFRKKQKTPTNNTTDLKRVIEYNTKLLPYIKAYELVNDKVNNNIELAKKDWESYVRKSFIVDKKNPYAMDMADAMAIRKFSGKKEEDFIAMGKVEGCNYSWDFLHTMAFAYIGGLYKLENIAIAFFYFHEKYKEEDTCEHLDLGTAPLFAQLCPLYAFLDKSIQVTDPTQVGFYFEEANEWMDNIIKKYGQKEFDKSWKSVRTSIGRKHISAPEYIAEKYHIYAAELIDNIKQSQDMER